MIIRLAILLSVILAGASHAAGDKASTSTISNVASLGRDLGVQVRRAMMMRGEAGVDRNGRHVIYTVLLGAPAVLVTVDLETARVVEERPLPRTSGAWGVKVSTDGTVYIGAYNEGLLYRYLPKSGELKNLGHPFPTRDSVLYPMAVAPDGKVYGGSYPSGHAYEFDPKTGTTRDLGDMTTVTANERWIRTTVHDPATNKLYFAVGNQPQLVEYDMATGSRRDLLPAKYANITAVYDLNVEGGRLFCRKESHNPYEYFVLDAKTGQEIMVTDSTTGKASTVFICGSRGLSPKSPESNKMYYVAMDRGLYEYDLDTNTVRPLGITMSSVITGYSWVKLDDPGYPGHSLVGTLGNGGALYRYNPRTGRHDVRQVDYTGQPVNIRAMVSGPDGKIYTGGYLAGNMGVYDPQSDTVKHLSGTGQTEGMVFIGSKLFMGIYPNAGVYEYDTARPWTAGGLTKPDDGDLNPSRIFSLENVDEIPGCTNQDRPFAMAGSEKLHRLFVGTVPKNGMLGGVLAIYDLETSGRPAVHWNIVPDQSIVALACKDGMLYGGTSIFGGMGVRPKAKEGVLFTWDVAAGRLVSSLVPVPGKRAVNCLHAGPDGNIWGMAGGTLFVFDPAGNRIVHTSGELPAADVHFAEGSLITGRDGNVYGAGVGRLFRVDPKTKRLEVLADGAKKVAQDREGRFYVNGDPITHLYQLDPAKLAASTADRR